ncbi:MAG: DUF6055 domain-containing protein, partial [Chitinispirillaceae bacterium]|nr:DUF6055 domain-containing protein [Chitinispirillaceae bacterium]
MKMSKVVLLFFLIYLLFSFPVFSEEEYKVLRPETSKYIYTSEHFAVRWNDKDNVVLTEAEINTGLANLEAAWKKFTDEIGFEKPYWDDSVKYKVSVNVSDQGWATGAGTGLKDPEIWVHYNAYKNAGVLAHEFTHSLQFATRALRDSKYVGWMWESHAQWMRHQMFPNEVDCAEMLVNMPPLYYGSTRNRYCNWHFWEFLKDKYGYKIINDIWSKGKKLGEAGYLNECPFTILARNQNWSVDVLNDHFGEWAMHNVSWDYKNGDVYRKAFGSYLDRKGARRLRVTLLEEIDKAKRRYAVPNFWAPQR